nr:hypothetical protein [uncultured Pseudomonas sp.]
MFNDERFPSRVLERIRPALKYAAACVLVVTPLCSAIAGDDQIKGESQYREAVKMLESIQGTLNSVAIKMHAGADPAQFDEEREAVRPVLAAVIEKLQEASDFGHPVAQYRFASPEFSFRRDREGNCKLLSKSADQGFAPAAVQFAVCSPFESKSHRVAQLKKAAANIELYAAYYPQPAVQLLCVSKPPVRSLSQLGQKENYLAEIYLMLAQLSGSRTPDGIQYLEQAVAANDCAYAAKRLEHLQPSTQ